MRDVNAALPQVQLGVDVGATKIAFGLVTSDGAILDSGQVPSRAQHPEELWTRLRTAITELVHRSEAHVEGVGIGSAGPIDVEAGTVSPVNISAWRDFPLVDALRTGLGIDRVAMRGDAIAFAHAEHRFGAGRGAEDMLGLVVSTGVGGGLVIGGRVHTGASGNAGYFGHMAVLADGEVCACGRRGCVEAYASGPQMVRHAVTGGWEGRGDFVALAESARQGDAIAHRAIREGSRALAVAIVNVLVTLDLRRVVIGGGVSRAGAIYWEPLRAHLQREMQAIGFLREVAVVPAALGADAGILGAALAVMD